MEKLTWQVHRARESPVRTLLVSAFIFLFLTLAAVYFGLLLAFVGLLALFVALHTYFLPISFTFDKDGITVDKHLFRHTYSWDGFRAWFRTTGGVVVSPFSRRTFLDNFRGVHLLLPDDPAPVIAWLEERFRTAPDSGPRVEP